MAVVDVSVLWFMFFMFVGAAIWAVATTVPLVIVSLFSPGWSFVKAKFKHQPILATRRRDRKIEYHRADTYIEGLAVDEKYKSGYIIDPDSVYTEKKSGVPVLPVNAEIGITLSEKVLNIIDALKRMGFNNIIEAQVANESYYLCNECGYEGFMEIVVDAEGKPLLKDKRLQYRCPNEALDTQIEEVEDVKRQVEKEEKARAEPTEYRIETVRLD